MMEDIQFYYKLTYITEYISLNVHSEVVQKLQKFFNLSVPFYVENAETHSWKDSKESNNTVMIT